MEDEDDDSQVDDPGADGVVGIQDGGLQDAMVHSATASTGQDPIAAAGTLLRRLAGNGVCFGCRCSRACV